jgi:1,2-diacylglycerol 3-alpha-glucosyltransferase
VNILMLSDVYHPRVNGVSTSIETFRHDLLALGHRVQLVAPAYDASSRPGLEPGITRVPGPRMPRDPEDRIMSGPRLRRRLAELGRTHWDVVHVHTPFLAHRSGVAFAARTGAPLLITYHTLFEEYLEHYVPIVPHRSTRALARRLSRTQCRQADAVVVPSRAMADRLHAYGVSPRLMTVLPTGLPDALYSPGDGAAFRAAHGIPADRPVALFVGRLAHEKNIEFLLESLHGVAARVPDALLLLAGDGPARAALQARAEQLGVAQRTRFLGIVRRGPALADCYAAADVFAFASRTETQGLVLLEAMAQRVPVLALSAMGTREIVEDCPGALVGTDRPGEFGAQLAALLADRARTRAMGVAAGAWAERWRGRVLARQLAELYASLPARRRPARTVRRWLRLRVRARALAALPKRAVARARLRRPAARSAAPAARTADRGGADPMRGAA